MGIQNYLKRVSKATKDIKSAIEEKGVSVAECDGIETLATAVRAIQTGSSSDGSVLFTVLAFTSSKTTPTTPSGGSFTESAITYPSGWSDGAGLTKCVWMSYIVFKSDGSVYKNWVSPILVNGVVDTDGSTIDLTDYATKVWVTEQIKNAGTGGTIDLSNYATKSYVDSKIAEISGVTTTYVKSINSTSGELTFTGSGVSQSGNTFTFSGGSSGSDVDKTYVDTQDAATLKSAKAYADGLVTSGVTSVNSLTGDVKIISGTSNVSVDTTNLGNIAISVTGGTGADGENGNCYEYVFALYDTLVEDSDMSIDNDAANADNAHTTDGYLPYFVFNTYKVKASGYVQSVSSAHPYQYVSVRYKPSGTNTEWGDFSNPKLYNNYTKASIDDETLKELKETATAAAEDSIKSAVSDINSVKEALGWDNTGTYKSINQWNEDSNTLNDTVGSVSELNTTVANHTLSLNEISEQISTLNDKTGELTDAGFLTTNAASKLFADSTDFQNVKSGLTMVQSDFSQMSNIYGKYLMDENGNYIDSNNYVIYTNSDASSALYMNTAEGVTKFYTYDSETKEYTEYTGDTSGYHLVGKDLFAVKEDNSIDQEKRTAAREEISTYGVIIADNIAAIKTQVSEDSASVVVAALAKDNNAAALILESGRNGLAGDGTTTGAQAILSADNITLGADKVKFTDPTGEQTIALVDSETGMFNVNTLAAGSIKTECIEGLLELSENVVNIDSAIKAIYAPDSELVVKKLETTNNGYTVKIGDNVDNVSTTRTLYTSVKGYSKYYYSEGDIDFTKSSDAIYVESGNTLYIPKINVYLNARNITSNKQFGLRAWLYKCAGNLPINKDNDSNSETSDTIVRQLTFATDSSSSLAIVSLSAESDTTINFSVNSITVSDLESGYYYIRFIGSGNHSGDNWLYTSHAKFYCDSFLLRTSSEIVDQGVFIGANSFKLASGSNATTGANLGEISLSTTSNGIISNGFVLSPVVNNIQVVTSVPETVIDGVIYIVLT